MKKIKELLNSRFGFFIKLIVSLSFILFFLNSVKFSEINIMISKVNYIHISVLLLLTIFRNIVGSFRFKILVRVRKNINISEVMSQYFIASFFNNFLPTAIGGDGVRAILVSRSGFSKSESILYIFFERFMGFYSLIFISFVSCFLWDVQIYIRNIIFIMVFGYSILFLVLNFFNTSLSYSNKFIKKIKDVFDLINKQKSIVWKVFFISLIYQLVSIYISFYVASVVLDGVSIIPFLTLVPLVWFFTMLPISLGGLGLREAAFIFLLASIGISKEGSIIVSLGTYFSLFISGVIGLFLYFKLGYSKLRRGYEKN